MHPQITCRTSKKKQRVHEMNMDRISELPDALLIQILSLLPSIYAVETCVLSKRWRSLWKYVPKLDYRYMKNDRFLSRVSPQFVHRFLLLHKSQILESMRLHVESDCEAIDIRIWIDCAVERGLRELELDAFSVEGYIRLPSNIYACKTIEILKLKNHFRVDVPESFTCFKSLKILNLHFVYYKDDDSVRRLFSSCPNLEELVVKRYIDNVIKFIIEVPSLKRLSIHDCSDGEGRRGYVINAPALNYLSIKGLQDFEFSLENTPELREANIIEVFDIHTDKIILPLASSVKRLSLSLSPVKARYVTSINFPQLVYLELSTSKTEWCDLLMILLSNSPNVQVLKLRDDESKDSRDRFSNSQFIKPVCVPSCLLEHLQVFKWERYNGLREEERQVATYILTTAKNLKEAKFSTKYVTCSMKNSTLYGRIETLTQKLEMLKELAREPTASPSCQLFFE